MVSPKPLLRPESGDEDYDEGSQTASSILFNQYLRFPGDPTLPANWQDLVKPKPEDDGQTSPVVPFGPDAVNRWVNTATTLDQSLTRSPTTPRRFQKQDTELKATPTTYFTSISDGGHTPGPAATSSTHASNGSASSDIDVANSGSSYYALQEMGRTLDNVSVGSAAQQTNEGVLEPSPVLKAASTKKLSPIKIMQQGPLVPMKPDHLSTRQDDSNTYTTAGLSHVLKLVYAPGPIPSAVYGAMPSQYSLSALSSPDTPTGARMLQRIQMSSDTPTMLITKDRNYVSFFIDTLLLKEKEMGREKRLMQEEHDSMRKDYEAALKLEKKKTTIETARIHQGYRQQINHLCEEVEEKEIQKAGMQTDINGYYAQLQAVQDSHKNDAALLEDRITISEQFIEYLLELVPIHKRSEAIKRSRSLGIVISGVIV